MPLPKPYYQDDYATIYHGDMTKILPFIDKVDMVFTDPPYGHNNNDGDLIHKKELIFGDKKSIPQVPRPILNDGPEADNFVRYLFSELKRILVSGGCCCCCGGGGPDPQFARWSLMLDKYIPFKQMVIWDKGPMGLGFHYRRSYEVVLIGQNGNPCKWYDTTNAVENIIRNGDFKEQKIIPSAKQHPTQKPVELCSHFIQLHTQKGETVLDPFMGSGTTLRAATNLQRKSIGIELDEEYCKMAVNRLKQQVLEL